MFDNGCRVLLYQAGADPHIKDPLGGTMTSKQLAMRDRLVFESCKRLGLPVAFDLAGGYAVVPGRTFAERHRLITAVHDATMRECVAVYVP
jgi:acetoin utilization deacetylase AcuC-like enzyme